MNTVTKNFNQWLSAHHLVNTLNQVTLPTKLIKNNIRRSPQSICFLVTAGHRYRWHAQQVSLVFINQVLQLCSYITDPVTFSQASTFNSGTSTMLIVRSRNYWNVGEKLNRFIHLRVAKGNRAHTKCNDAVSETANVIISVLIQGGVISYDSATSPFVTLEKPTTKKYIKR